MTRLIIANLLIVTAMVMLGLAYRLKQNHTDVKIFSHRVKRQPRRRPGPSRIERLLLELSIVFNSALYGLTGA